MNNLFSQNDAIGRKSYTSTQYMSDSKTQSATDPQLARISPLLRCPACAGEFAMDDTGYRCRNCDEHYPLHEGVPMLARKGTVESESPGDWDGEDWNADGDDKAAAEDDDRPAPAAVADRRLALTPRAPAAAAPGRSGPVRYR